MPRPTLLFLAIVVASLFGCVPMRLEFTTEDPLITLLINKIQEYDSIQGHPPSELEDLIPGYLKTIPMPV